MSEEGFRGGIGGMDGAREESAARAESPMPAARQIPAQDIERLVDIAVRAFAADMRIELDQFRAEIEGLRQQIVQIQGEKQQIVNACAQYQQAIMDHANKLNALAAATSRNYRVEAARIAASCRQPAEPVSRLREMTEMWLAIFRAPEEHPGGDTRAGSDEGEIPRGIFEPGRDTSKDN